jgi:hypothetical protein
MAFKEEILLASKADTRGFKVTESAASKLNKRIKSLAITFGVAFSVKKVVDFGKAAARAFLEDQKQATRLANAVKNLGLQFSNPAIASYIDRLTIASGVSDSLLRPALQALLTTTGDLTMSQELLAQAIDIAAGSGIDLTTVAQDLANAYIGKTKALTKYNLGLTTAELKTIKFTDLMKKLNSQFSGANAAFLETYAGRIQAITNAAGEAQEAIGGALVDALMTLTSSDNTAELIGNIEKATQKIIDFIDWFTLGIALIKANTPRNPFEIIFPNFKRGKEDTAAAWKDYNDKRMRRSNAKAQGDFVTPAQTAELKKAAAVAAKRARDQKAALDKQNAALKKQADLKKAGTVFDLDQINLIAALKGKLSEDDKLRAQAQLALLNDNDVLATQLTKQILMAQDSTGKLYQYFLSIGDTKIKNPFAFLDEWIVEFQKKMNSLNLPDLSKPSTYSGMGMDPTLAAIGVIAGYGDFAGSVSSQASTTLGNGSYGMQSTAGFVSTAAATGMDVKVYVSGSVVTEEELVDAIQTGLRSNSLSGSPSQIGRIAGMFS